MNNESKKLNDEENQILQDLKEAIENMKKSSTDPLSLEIKKKLQEHKNKSRK